MAAEGLKRVKMLVLGDPGVGKSSLVHLLCHQEVLSNPVWTAGCAVEVKLHDYKTQSYFLEFWDVGGSPSHKRGRSVFYQNANGVILVHDLTNRKSHSNLTKWLTEFQESQGGGGGGGGRNGRSLFGESRNASSSDLQYDPERFADLDIPFLIVGTKADQPSVAKSSLHRLTDNTSINVDCTDSRQLSVDKPQLVEFNNFFDKVIERRYFHNFHMTSSHGERLRVHTRRTSGTSLS